MALGADPYTLLESVRDGQTGAQVLRPIAIVANGDPVLSERALGILFSYKVISQAQFRAGDLWAYGRYLDCGSAHVRAGPYQEVIKGADHYEDLGDDKWGQVLKYREAREALKACNSRIFNEVWNVAIEGRLPGWFQRQARMVSRRSDKVMRDCLDYGLDVLAEVYGVSSHG